MKVAVLAIQGAFAEHKLCLKKLGVDVFELRQKKDLEESFDALILPGGESTVQGKLLKELDMFDLLKEKIQSGMPVLATCAGLILLAEQISNDPHVYFGTLPVTVRRNAYGRQLGSFYTTNTFGPLSNVPMTFIRAPYIESVNCDADIIAKADGHIVGIRYQNQIGISFHPELGNDLRIHEMLLSLVST